MQLLSGSQNPSAQGWHGAAQKIWQLLNISRLKACWEHSEWTSFHIISQRRAPAQVIFRSSGLSCPPLRTNSKKCTTVQLVPAEPEWFQHLFLAYPMQQKIVLLLFYLPALSFLRGNGFCGILFISWSSAELLLTWSVPRGARYESAQKVRGLWSGILATFLLHMQSVRLLCRESLSKIIFCFLTCSVISIITVWLGLR